MERIRVAVVGRTRSGKSTFVNALLGEDVCSVSAAVDTTDKIQKLAVGDEKGQSRIYLFDTPGVGGEEGYEDWTRSYLGLPLLKDRPGGVPICQVDRWQDCPSVVRETHPSEPSQTLITLPHPFEQRKSSCGKLLKPCEEAGCRYWLRIAHDKPEMQQETPDVVLFLHRASTGGLARDDQAFLGALLGKYTVGSVRGLLTCVDELTQRRGLREVQSTIKDQIGRMKVAFDFRPISIKSRAGLGPVRRELRSLLYRKAKDAYLGTRRTIRSRILPKTSRASAT